jgi:nitrite reductase/ring-hydroxylating ferredoxin subunit
MSEDPHPDEPRPGVDPRVTSPARDGLAGTAPVDLYVRTRDQITIAPDFKPPEAQPAWRRDFPIDWPQDQYVERRDFMKFLVLISFAFTSGQFWIAAQQWWQRHGEHAVGRRIASVDDLAVGGTIVFDYPGEHDPCVLVRVAADSYVAYSQKCTHLSCAVIPQPDKGVLHCPCHEGYFDLQSGRPIAGPPSRPLPRIHREVRDGAIYATGVEWRTT